ncbi:MFS family permease [Ancylobacter sp. 3268]|uniref:MFS transporter n=1 Tax=Ancylobacter sp. 3268 TaxID=2817752 RepID=UPI002857F173|nr:MFS transporter [Ancylobacter sp. 3268]MDR6955539.1 MFS family permease [Ancylobacter sp. 3268]
MSIATPLVYPATSARWGWFVTGFLSIFFVLSFVDRTIVGLLVQPIAEELSASDIEMGLLYGTVFGLAYSLMGLPAAYLIDSGRRKAILVSGVVLWSASTALCAFVPNYTWLLIFRMGIAIGEAVLSPAAVSMIADLFPRHKRHLPTSVYLTTGVLMATGSYFIGGFAIKLAALVVPEALSSWRATMLVVGLPGIVLGLLFGICIPDPARTEDVVPAQSAANFTRHLLAEWRLYPVIIFAGGLISLVSFGIIGWLPTVMIRQHGLSPADAGFFVGLIGIPSSIAGALGVPMVGAWLERRGRNDALLLLLVASAASMACFALLPLATGPAMVALCLVPGLVGVMSKITLTTLIIQRSVPGRMRARFVALIMLMTNLAGFGLGPLMVALIAERWHVGPSALAAGMSTLALMASPVAFAAFASALPSYRRLLRTT